MTLSATAPDELPGRIGDAGAALLATLAFLALHAATGLATLSNAAGDNDSLLRLVQVRDLIAGQGWFDLHQYRMGPDGGFVMHWSRLVDAPVAAIMLAASALTGNTESGEAAALVFWPAMLFAAAMFFLLRAARNFAGAQARLPALVLGAASLHYTGIFAPGALDHHNLQLVLTLAMVSFLLDASGRNSAALGAVAGASAALLIAVAMEAVPYVAAGGAAVALWFLFNPATTRRVAAGFGLAFGGLAGAFLLVTVPPHAWFASECDAFSLPQFSGAGLSGFGLAAIAASAAVRKSFSARLAALGGLAALLVIAFVAFFPQCLGDPYAGLDPRMKSWWLSAVTEAQPLWTILSVSPAMAAGHYATPLLALFCLASTMRRRGVRREHVLIAGFLGAAFLVSLWQVRGSMFAIPLAVIPLSAFVAGWRGRASGEVPASTTAKMLCAWLLSFNVSWSAAAGGLADAFAPDSVNTDAAAAQAIGACEDAGDFVELAAMPATAVLIISNLGAPVLRHTPHRVLAGPYHRNVEGNLAVIDAFTGPVAGAEDIARRHEMGLVALCRGNDESKVFAERAPDGLMAALLLGEVPRWLEIVPASRGKPLELYRVLPRG